MNSLGDIREREAGISITSDHNNEVKVSKFISPDATKKERLRYENIYREINIPTFTNEYINKLNNIRDEKTQMLKKSYLNIFMKYLIRFFID